ncbi:PREDICTED: calcineurin B-like protein 7 [Ipomoea nil]|uniref:calcineurin B-like protein 7 n=1 Tax=Ipomoea nil TaxID=35883 RepID=UPI00090124E8|nr:PREDICTED: calcineurin B-like protein 7 [Ipomoea nil]
MRFLVGCFCLKQRHTSGFDDHLLTLASQTAFTVNEVEALYVLYEKLSRSLIDDGLIHKEEFLLGMFECSNKQNLMADRLFDLFDLKRNGVIEFGEFVQSLNVFHPRTPESVKIAFAFRLYDLKQTGYIEREELKEMVLATISETGSMIAEDVIEAIVDKTISEADMTGDGRISPEEWKQLVARNPALISNMTLPEIREVTIAFPSFITLTRVQDWELQSESREFCW